MSLRFSDGHCDDFEAIAHQMAEAQDDDYYPTGRQERITATLLEASFRLGECDDRSVVAMAAHLC